MFETYEFKPGYEEKDLSTLIGVLLECLRNKKMPDYFADKKELQDFVRGFYHGKNLDDSKLEDIWLAVSRTSVRRKR